MYCKNCGKPIDEEAKFCENCGKERTRNVEQVKKVNQYSPIIESAPTNSVPVNAVYKAPVKEQLSKILLTLHIISLIGFLYYLFFNYYIGMAILYIGGIAATIYYLVTKLGKNKKNKVLLGIASVVMGVVCILNIALNNKINQICYDVFEGTGRTGRERCEDLKYESGFASIYENADNLVAYSKSDLHELTHELK